MLGASGGVPLSGQMGPVLTNKSTESAPRSATIGTFGLEEYTSGPDEEDQAPPAGGRTLRSRLFVLAALVVVACGVLAAGTGLFDAHTRHPSLYQRTMAIAGEYRCPVCAGESAADSSAPAAVDIRHLVRKWLQEGEGQAQIRANLISDYGESILLKPPASGLDVLVWAVPALAVALGAAGLTFAFVRWKRAATLPGSGPLAMAAPPREPSVGLPVPEGKSLAPSATASVQGRLFELEPPGAREPAPAPPAQARHNPQPWYRRLMLPAGLVLLVAGVALWLVDRTSPQLPGGTITGSLTGLNVELSEARALEGKDPAKALQIYAKILASDPGQPIALTAEGWIFAEAGFASQAMPLLTKAEKVDPSYDLAHLYRGLVLLEYEKDPSGAAGELTWYLAHGPSPSLVKVAREALSEAKSEAKAAVHPRGG